MWELCYKICFTTDFNPQSEAPAKVDRLLFEEDGEVDWTRLDEKAKQLVMAVLSQLPTVEVGN